MQRSTGRLWASSLTYIYTLHLYSSGKRTAGLAFRGRIGELAVLHDEKRGGFVESGGRLVQDMQHLPALRGERIGYQRTMAAPGDGFGTHDSCHMLPGNGAEGLQSLLEGIRCHIVGVATKREVVPAGIWRLLAGAAQPSQLLEIGVGNTSLCERGSQFLRAKLGIAARAGDGAYINEFLNIVGGEQVHKFLDAARRMADCVERLHTSYCTSEEQGQVRHLGLACKPVQKAFPWRGSGQGTLSFRFLPHRKHLMIDLPDKLKRLVPAARNLSQLFAQIINIPARRHKLLVSPLVPVVKHLSQAYVDCSDVCGHFLNGSHRIVFTPFRFSQEDICKIIEV